MVDHFVQLAWRKLTNRSPRSSAGLRPPWAISQGPLQSPRELPQIDRNRADFRQKLDLSSRSARVNKVFIMNNT